MAGTGRFVFTTADTRCWHRDGGALILSVERVPPAITPDVLDAMVRAVTEAERGFATLVITSSSAHFAFGANLDAAAHGRPDVLDAAHETYQRVMLRLRHAGVPTVAAVRGVAISGGCEVLCGDGAAGTMRTEAELLALERKHFVELAITEKTQARLVHLRGTGRPLVN